MTTEHLSFAEEAALGFWLPLDLQEGVPCDVVGCDRIATRRCPAVRMCQRCHVRLVQIVEESGWAVALDEFEFDTDEEDRRRAEYLGRLSDEHYRSPLRRTAEIEAKLDRLAARTVGLLLADIDEDLR